MSRLSLSLQVTMQMVRDILMYMDRTFVSFNKKMPVYEMGLVVFRDTVARHEKVKGRLQSLLLQVTRRDGRRHLSAARLVGGFRVYLVWHPLLSFSCWWCYAAVFPWGMIVLA